MHVFQLFQRSRIHGVVPSIDLRVPAVLFELRTSLSGLMLFLYPFDPRGRGSARTFEKMADGSNEIYERKGEKEEEEREVAMNGGIFYNLKDRSSIHRSKLIPRVYHWKLSLKAFEIHQYSRNTNING